MHFVWQFVDLKNCLWQVCVFSYLLPYLKKEGSYWATIFKEYFIHISHDKVMERNQISDQSWKQKISAQHYM